MVFQFDSEGIRHLARKVGVQSFDDLVALTALYRPGPLDMGMDKVFCNRKHGLENFDIHPLLQPFMSSTYNVLLYQEQAMEMLRVAGNIPKKDCSDLVKAISKKKLEKFAPYKKQFIDNTQKNLDYSEIEAKRLWEEIEAFSAYAFNLAHAVAYSYISARCLWLKTYYPKEYFTAVLSCLKTGDERFKEYKKDVAGRNITLSRLSLNKSKSDFNIEDNVYFAFSKIKGIGEDITQRIIAGQPYKDFIDFLERFGTEAKVIQPLIALGCFGDNGLIWKYQYYEHYKYRMGKRKARRKRRADSEIRYKEQLKEVLGEGFYEVSFDDFEVYETLIAEKEPEKWKALVKMNRMRERSVNKFYEREKEDLNKGFNVDFKPDDYYVNPDLEVFFGDREKAELAYYGFIWTHPLEKLQYYKEQTFEAFRKTGRGVGPVEVLVKKVEHKTAKNKKTKYWSLKLDDGNEENFTNVWENDYKVFHDLLKEGNLLRMMLLPPKEPFRTWSLQSLPRFKKVNRELDMRVIEIT